MSATLVRSILDRSGLTITQLAGRAGMSRASVSEYLHGHRNPSLRQLERLAGAVGLDLDVAVRSSWADRRKQEFEGVLEFGDLMPFRSRQPDGPPTWAELTRR